MAIFVVGVADAVFSTRAVVSAGAAETIFTTGVLSRNMGNRRDTAGVWVSNHGGRCLDTLPATIEVLPEIVSAVNGRVPVMVDGGIRRGSDVLKALALGASFVFVGRPMLSAAAVAGEKDACGVGFLASLKGVSSHWVLQQALRGLDCMEHRGGCGGYRREHQLLADSRCEICRGSRSEDGPLNP